MKNTGELNIKKRYSVVEPEYAVPITEVYSKLELSYTDVATPKYETIAEDSYVPTWLEPPDFKIGMVWAEQSQNLDNSWVRTGTKYEKSGLNITDIDRIQWHVLIKDAWSVKAAKIYNPWPYTMKVWVKGVASDKTTAVGDINIWHVKSGCSVEMYLVDFVKQAKNAAAVYVSIVCSVYDEDLTDNYIEAYSTTGFYIGLPDADPSTGRAWGPSIALDCYNIIDRYGLYMAMAAGALSGVELSFAALKQAEPIREMAAGLGVGVSEVAGILAVGLYERWITMSDVWEYILPSVAMSLTPAVATFALNRLPSKYGGMLGSGAALAIGGAAAAGSFGLALVMLTMIDDVEATFEV